MDEKLPYPDAIDACNAAQPIGPAADEEGWVETKPKPEERKEAA